MDSVEVSPANVGVAKRQKDNVEKKAFIERLIEDVSILIYSPLFFHRDGAASHSMAQLSSSIGLVLFRGRRWTGG